MAEHLLNGPQVRSAVEQMCGRRMTQRVRPDRRRAQHRPRVPAQRRRTRRGVRCVRHGPRGRAREPEPAVSVRCSQVPGGRVRGRRRARGEPALRTARHAPWIPCRAPAVSRGRNPGRRCRGRRARTRAPPIRRAPRASRESRSATGSPRRRALGEPVEQPRTASAVATLGSVRPRLGATRRRLGSAATRPVSAAHAKKPRAAAVRRASVDRASPRCVACQSHSRSCSRSTSVTSASATVAARSRRSARYARTVAGERRRTRRGAARRPQPPRRAPWLQHAPSADGVAPRRTALSPMAQPDARGATRCHSAWLRPRGEKAQDRHRHPPAPSAAAGDVGHLPPCARAHRVENAGHSSVRPRPLSEPSTGGSNSAGEGPPSSSSTSSALVTHRASNSRRSRWHPAEAALVTGPGTAPSGRESAAACPAVLSDPLRQPASTTTVASASAAMSRLR